MSVIPNASHDRPKVVETMTTMTVVRPASTMSTTSSMADQQHHQQHLYSTLIIDRIESSYANRDLETLLSLIHDEGVSPNYHRCGKIGNTPLILAVREGDEEAVVDLLSQCRADPHLANDLGRTPLMAAAASGMEHIVTLLLIETPEGAPRTTMIFQQDLSGKNALDWARIGRRPRCIRTLQLAVQRTIEYCRSERKEKSRKESLRLLIEENRDRRRLMEHAILNRDTESIQDLACPLKHANLQWDPSNKVMTLETLRRGDFDKTDKTKQEFLPSSTFEPERPNIGKGVIIGVAVRAALEHAVEEMHSDGARIVDPTPLDGFLFAHPDRHVLFSNHECMGGITPLMYAAGNDIPDLVTLLVRRAGADVNLRSTRIKHTPLTWASCSGSMAAVTALLSEGAELDYPSSEGRTALMVACSNAHKHMVAMMLEKSMHLAQRRAARDADAQYGSLVRVLGHEIAAHARYSEAGKESEGWQKYFDELVFGLKDDDGRNAVTHARMSMQRKRVVGGVEGVAGGAGGGAGGGPGHTNMITEMLEQAKARIVDRQDKLAYQRWMVEPIKCELCSNWEKRNRMDKHTMYNCPMRLVRCTRCNDPMPAKLMNKHVENSCERRLLACTQKCGKEIEARHLDAHSNNFCKRRIVLCRLECGARCHWNARTTHEVDQCPNRQIDCTDCGENMQAKTLSYHSYNLCPQRLVFCGRGCEHRGPFVLNKSHEDEECLLRPLPCRYNHLGCEKIIGPPDKREVHELYLCPKRPVSCRLGECRHVCRAEEMPHHVTNVCAYRMVECNNKCGVNIMAKDREKHERPGETGLCRNRPVRCRHDWVGNRVRVHRATNAALDGEVSKANPQGTSHAQWEEGIVIGFESVPIVRKGEKQMKQKKQKKQQESKGEKKCEEDNDEEEQQQRPSLSGEESILEEIERIAKLLMDRDNGLIKGEGTTTRLKARFGQRIEWINAGATYNFHSVSEADGDHWACDWVPALHREKHEHSQCGHRMVRCTLGCEQEIASKYFEHHVNETCPYRTTPCPQGCGQDVPLKQLADHKDEFCTKRIIECDDCEESMKQDELFEHMRLDCTMIRVRCPNACGKTPRRHQLDRHLNEKCAKRVIQCKWKCDVDIFADAATYHESTVCTKRELLCPDQCGASVVFFLVKKHLKDDCEKRILLCSLHCGMSTMAKDVAEHLSNYCPKRLYRCYLGCGEDICVVDRESHEEEYCMRRIRSCTLGCGRIIRADRMDQHVDHVCRRRVVGCPHGCDDIVRAEDVKSHGAMCGMRPIMCGAGSHACCRQLRQWTRMIPVNAPFPAVLAALPEVEEEEKKKKEEEEEEEEEEGPSVDRDGLLRPGEVAIETEMIIEDVDDDMDDDIDNASEPKERRILIICDQHASTGLHQASAMGDVDLVRALLFGLSTEDLDREDPQGTTPLMRAAFHGHTDVARMLVESGATIDLENSRGRTAMMEAVVRNHPGVVWELMMLGGEYTRANRFGQIPLKMAIRYDDPKGRDRVHTDEFGTDFTTMELVTDIARLREEHRRLLVAISMEDWNICKSIVQGGEKHRPCHIHQLHAEKPFLWTKLADCRDKEDHYRKEMEFCRDTSNDCDVRVKVLQRRLRENQTTMDMLVEEEASWAFAAHEKQEEVIRVLRGLSASHVMAVVKMGRRPPLIVCTLLKGLCILRGVRPAYDRDGNEDYVGPAHALLTNRQLLRFLRQYDPSSMTTPSAEIIECLMMEIIGKHPNVNDDIGRLPEHYPLLYALGTWISSCLFLNRRTKMLPILSKTMEQLMEKRTELDHELAPNLMQQRYLTNELIASTLEYTNLENVAQAAQKRYDGLDRMIWVTRVLQFRESARHSALSWACSRQKSSKVIVQLLIDNGAAIDTTTEEEHAAASLVQMHVRHLQWMASRGMWTPARAYGFKMREMSHAFAASRTYNQLKKEQTTSRSPLAETLFAGNSSVAELLIQNGATLTKRCSVVPSGHGPFTYFQVPLGVTIEDDDDNVNKEMDKNFQKKSKKKKKKTDSKARGRARLFLGDIGLGEEGKLPHCDVMTGPADCLIAMFEHPVSFMTVSRLGVTRRQGRSEFFEGGSGWTQDKSKLSHHESVRFAWENITQKHEEIIAKELDRQRRLIIAEQVERTQRIGRIKMTKAVHSYEFEEALRLVDEEEIAIDVETLYGYTALGLAASEGTESVNDEGIQVLAVEMLLDRLPGKIRPAINRETNGMTPLMWAANHGNVDVAESLIDRGATIDYVTKDWAPPHILPPPGAFAAEDAAAAAMVQEDLTRLVRSFPGGSTRSEMALVEAAEEIAKAAANGSIITTESTKSGEQEPIIERKEDTLYQTKKTPLIVATCAGHKKMVWLLLQYGADQSLKDSVGRNALEWSALLGNHDLMQMLAQSRASFFGDVRSKEGKASHSSCRNGCGARVAPKKLEHHEKNECSKRVVPCPNEPCGCDELWSEEIAEHLLVCGNRVIECSGCGENIHLLQLATPHEDQECPDRYVPCPYECGKSDVKAKLLKNHCKLWCKRRPIECTNQCGEIIPNCEMLAHKRVCLRRQVRCLLGCGEEMPFEERDEHQERHCAKRWVECKWKGCEGTSADRKEMHESEECRNREILCVCDKIILGMDYENHLKNFCINRTVDCRHRKCNCRFSFFERAKHEATFCQQRWVSCMFRDVQRTTELGPDTSEILEPEDRAAIEELSVALQVKDIDDLNSKSCRVIGCGARVHLNEMEEHWESECRLREVPCGAGCGVMYCAGNVEHHKTNMCSKRIVTCHLGCMSTTKAEDLKNHEERICKFRKVYCANGCGNIMLEYQRKLHERDICHLRFVECTNECGEKLRHEDLEHHLLHNCGMRAYRPPAEDYPCSRCNFENKKSEMEKEYGEDVFTWKCQVCKLPPHKKGMSVAESLKRNFSSGGGGGGGGLSTNLFGGEN